MVVGISTANLGNAWMNMLKGTAFTAPAATWVELHTADPGASGATSVSVGSATRLQAVSATWTTSTVSSLVYGASIGPWTNAGTSETLTHIAVFSLVTAGVFYWSAALTTPQAWNTGNTFTLTSASITFSPLAA